MEKINAYYVESENIFTQLVEVILGKVDNLISKQFPAARSMLLSAIVKFYTKAIQNLKLQKSREHLFEKILIWILVYVYIC